MDYFSITAGKRKGRYQETKEKCTQANPAAAVGKPENILLQVDANGPNWSDVHVAKALHCHGKTIRNVRSRFVEQGLEAALVRQKHAKPSRQRLLDGAKEAHLMALRCGTLPKARPSGPYSCWPLHSLHATWLRLSPMKQSDKR